MLLKMTNKRKPLHNMKQTFCLHVQLVLENVFLCACSNYSAV